MTTLKSVAIAACLTAPAFGQATSPVVGYETLDLRSGEFNLVGLRLLNSAVASGSFDSSTSDSLTDDEATFNLDGATTYEVEFSTGASITAAGSDFADGTLSNVSGVDNTFESNYVVRIAPTVSTVFGVDNSAGLTASPNADPTEADNLFIPNGSGFTRIFFSTFADDSDFAGWLDADSFAQVPDFVLDPSQGLFIQSRAATANSVVVSGSVKTTPTVFSAAQDFSLVGSVYPAGSTLSNSDLDSFILSSANADPTEADVIFLPNGSGGFVRAFFSTFADDADFAGWLDADSFAQIPDQELTSGFFIQKRSAGIVDGVLSPPAFYTDL